MADSLTFTITGDVGSPSSIITAIDVYDVFRGKHYTWTDGGGWASGEPRAMNGKTAEITVTVLNQGFSGGVTLSIVGAGQGEFYRQTLTILAGYQEIGSCTVTLPATGDLTITVQAAP